MDAASSTPRDSDGVPDRLCRVAFDLPDRIACRTGIGVVRLWTEKSGKLEVRVLNVPFYVKGISFGDVVRIRPDHERREFVFEELLSESGGSTMRIILRAAQAEGEVGALLRAADCEWEVGPPGISLWAIDVPAHVNYASVRADLLNLADAGTIDIEEGAISGLHRAGLG